MSRGRLFQAVALATIIAAALTGCGSSNTGASDAAFNQWKTSGQGGDAVRALKAAPQVLDAAWYSRNTIWVGVWDNGKPRNGFAQAMCEVMAGAGWHGDAYVHIGDNRDALNGKLREIGRYRCKR